MGEAELLGEQVQGGVALGGDGAGRAWMGLPRAAEGLIARQCLIGR